MKKLFDRPTVTLCKLVDQLQGNDVLRINITGHNLLVKKTDCCVQTPQGIGAVYMVGTYQQLNGETLPDPEFTFIVIDERDTLHTGYNRVRAYPQSCSRHYTQQEAVTIQDHEVIKIDKATYTDQWLFANYWLQQVKYAGFTSDKAVIKVAKR